MDVDPFEPVGISEQTGRFLDAFLLFCALEESLAITPEQSAQYTENFARTVKEGRRPGLTLHNGKGEVPLTEFGAELLERIRPVAGLLDQLRGDSAHGDALAAQSAKLADPDLTPSARVLAALRANGKSFAAFGLAQSEKHAAYFRSHPTSLEDTAYFDGLAGVSLAEQAEMEAAQQSSFDDYVAAYRASNLCQSVTDCG